MKLELKENMYVRTEEGKIFKTDGDLIYLNNDKTILYKLITRIPHDTISYKVIKASYNIIDILKVGDVIIDKEGHKYPINYEFETDYNDEYKSYEITIDDYITLFLKDGLSIVTHEQMEQMAYKVGE